MKESKLKSRWPKDHFSWSQYNVWVNYGPAEFAKKYIYGGADLTNPRMELGKTVADMLEHDEENEDPILEHLRVFLPHYQHREYEIRKQFNGITLVGKLDGFNENPMRLGEYKTGVRWTQEMADKTEELDWYALLLHLQFGVNPLDVPFDLVWIPTKWDFPDDPKPTGEIYTFKTRRSYLDSIRIGKKIMKAWNEIGEFCAKEYRDIGM